MQIERQDRKKPALTFVVKLK